MVDRANVETEIVNIRYASFVIANCRFNISLGCTRNKTIGDWVDAESCSKWPENINRETN